MDIYFSRFSYVKSCYFILKKYDSKSKVQVYLSVINKSQPNIGMIGANFIFIHLVIEVSKIQSLKPDVFLSGFIPVLIFMYLTSFRYTQKRIRKLQIFYN